MALPPEPIATTPPGSMREALLSTISAPFGVPFTEMTPLFESGPLSLRLPLEDKFNVEPVAIVTDSTVTPMLKVQGAAMLRMAL